MAAIKNYRKPERKTLRFVGAIILGGFLLYSGAMIMIRLKMTEMAYQFEDLKKYERQLHEEQMKLRVKLSEDLSPRRLKAEGYREPEPKQIIAIP